MGYIPESELGGGGGGVAIASPADVESILDPFHYYHLTDDDVNRTLATNDLSVLLDVGRGTAQNFSAADGDRPEYFTSHADNGRGYAKFVSASTEFMTNPSSTALWQFLHNGTRATRFYCIKWNNANLGYIISNHSAFVGSPRGVSERCGKVMRQGVYTGAAQCVNVNFSDTPLPQMGNGELVCVVVRTQYMAQTDVTEASAEPVHMNVRINGRDLANIEYAQTPVDDVAAEDMHLGAQAKDPVDNHCDMDLFEIGFDDKRWNDNQVLAYEQYCAEYYNTLSAA